MKRSSFIALLVILAIVAVPAVMCVNGVSELLKPVSFSAVDVCGERLPSEIDGWVVNFQEMTPGRPVVVTGFPDESIQYILTLSGTEIIPTIKWQKNDGSPMEKKGNPRLQSEATMSTWNFEIGSPDGKVDSYGPFFAAMCQGKIYLDTTWATHLDDGSKPAPKERNEGQLTF